MDRDQWNALCAARVDQWLPACGGSETPFLKNGNRYLYVFNPSSCTHAYLDCGTDLVLDDAAARALGLY